MQTHLTFGREFTEAVEMKQVAQQEAERARYLVERVQFSIFFTALLFITAEMVKIMICMQQLNMACVTANIWIL